MAPALCHLLKGRHAAALAIAVVLALACCMAAANEPTDAPIAILIEADTGNVLFERRSAEPFPPGSMSKLMTLAVVFRALKSGAIDRNVGVTVSENAWRKGGAMARGPSMFLPLGGKASIDELVRGTAIVYANDGAIALAEGISGSEDAFVKAMNDEATTLGLQKSTFTNATGIYDPHHQMSARDLVLLAGHIVKEFPDHYAVFAQQESTSNKVPLINRNPLLGTHLGADGLVTGYVEGSGYGIVFSAVRNRRRLIGMVMGLKSREERTYEASRLLAYGFEDVELKAPPADKEASNKQPEHGQATQFECRNYFPGAGVVLAVPCME